MRVSTTFLLDDGADTYEVEVSAVVDIIDTDDQGIEYVWRPHTLRPERAVLQLNNSEVCVLDICDALNRRLAQERRNPGLITIAEMLIDERCRLDKAERGEVRQ